MILLLLLAQDIDVTVETGFRRLNGSMRFDEAPAVGDTLDLHRDLGLTSWEPVAALAAGVRSGAHRFHASLGGFRAEGDDVLEAPMRWNETQFNAGERVKTELDVYDLQAGWTYLTGVGDDIAGFALAPTGGFRYTRVRWELSSGAKGRDDDNLGAFWPQAGLGVFQVPFGVRVDMAVGGIRARDVEVFAASAAMGVAFHSDRVSISVLWREESLSFLSTRGIQRNRMRWGWDGVVLEIAVRF